MKTKEWHMGDDVVVHAATRHGRGRPSGSAAAVGAARAWHHRTHAAAAERRQENGLCHKTKEALT